jgi:ATP-dependent Zn protease
MKDYPFDFYKVTILSRGGTLGVSWALPKDDHTSYSKEELFAKIVVSMAGRAAEAIIFNKVCTGAYSDFQGATNIAFDMVKSYGMGKRTGMMSYVNYKTISQETQREVDLEIQELVQAGYDKAFLLLTENLDLLNKLAIELLEKKK